MTNITPLSVAEVPRIDSGLELVKAKDLFLKTLESGSTKRAYARHADGFCTLMGPTTIGRIEAGHLVAYRNYLLMDGRGPDHPRFIFSGEFLTCHQDGAPSQAVRAPGLLQAIAQAGIPIAAEVQARNEAEAHERFAAASGIKLEVVKDLFPVVVLVDGLTPTIDYLVGGDGGSPLPGRIVSGL